MTKMLNKKRSLALKQGRGGAAIKGAKEGFTAEAQRMQRLYFRTPSPRPPYYDS
jgi:hypothetical protein